MQNKSNIIWLTFLMLQPFIDMIALYSNSLPSLIRGGFLLYSAILLIKQKRARIYLTLISLYGLTHLVLIYYLKDPVSLTVEISYLIKTAYFPIVLLFAKNIFQNDTYVNVILFNQLIINLIMILSGMTQTGKRTYDMLAKQGHTGWFFSGNELSVILMIGLAMILFKLMTETHKKGFFLLFPFLIVHMMNMMIVGTKVSLFSIFILLGVATLLAFKRESNKSLGTTLLILFFIVYFAFPHTPAGHNTLRLVNEPELTEVQDQNNEQVIDQMLSGRRDFLFNNIKQYKNAPLALKSFGLGYGGLYDDQPKLVEMDAFDWLFGFGLIGTLILIYPLLVLALEITGQLNWRLSKQTFLLLIALLLTGGSAFTAGHVLSAPAVSIYLILLLIILYQSFNKHKNLLVITTMYPGKKTPSFGIFIKNQIEQVKDHQFNVDLLAIKNDRMDHLNVVYKYTAWLIKFSFTLIFKAERYHVIHAHYLFPSGWLGRIAKRIYGTRLIVTAHGGDIDKMPQKHPKIEAQIHIILTEADQIIAVGEKLKQVINKKYQIAHNKLTVLNMGVNRNIFKPGSKLEAREKFNLPPDKKIILFVGNLIKAKGLEELVKACAILTDQFDLECHLVGANKEPLFFEKLIQSTTIKIHHHKATNQKQIANWLRAADLFVLPSHMEGFGLVALEAMACHTPVIGTNVGGLAYLLAGESGLIVPPVNPDALANAIRQLLTNETLRDKLIKNGEEKANRFDQDKVIKKLIQLYDNEELER
ncbi:O-antigen ligase family protein [Globicatella sulfidifaciens]|uniref:Glycosyltransferase n=1 Tax=Globicatella sulfidifaciens TaxID=136093 RepID=A0A7X8C5W5_9LACT|nr:O-antigen ligase family protein [Globicatella sulfidifaciens]NLJ19463.1 glycosyltransferase [Globicatella sulfidifaciens]